MGDGVTVLSQPVHVGRGTDGKNPQTLANGGDYRRPTANSWVLGTEFATGWSPRREIHADAS